MIYNYHTNGWKSSNADHLSGCHNYLLLIDRSAGGMSEFVVCNTMPWNGDIGLLAVASRLKIDCIDTSSQ